MIWSHAHHTGPTAWAIQGGSWGSSPAHPLPPATDALSPDVDTSSVTSTGPTAAAWARGSLLQLGSAGCALAIELYQVPQQGISPKMSLSLSLAAAGVVERYNGPQKPWPLPGPQEDVGETAIKAERKREEGKIWSKEKDTISKETWPQTCLRAVAGQGTVVCLSDRTK